MHDTYDGIVLGAGHNGLILSAYLARAGLEVVCLERRDTAGGGLSTVEMPPGSGFWHNTHAFFHRGLTQLPWYRDLELARHGAEYVQPPLNVAAVCRDGRVLGWWEDWERTVESVAQFSTRDAGKLRHWREVFLPIVRDILLPEAAAPPLPPAQRQRLLSRSPAGRTLVEVSRLSPLQFVQREFEHPTVRGALLFFNGLREVDLREPGFGHHIPALLASDRYAQMCRGGSRRLAEALVAAAGEAGGKLWLEAQPERVLVESGRVVGVETASGDVVRARKFVASSLNPQQTFLELIGSRYLPADWVRKAEAFQYNLLAPLFSLNVNLGEPPAYTAAANVPELSEALMVLLGVDDDAVFGEIVDHHQAGTIPPTVMWGGCPTQFDPSQAPPGRHTAFMWEKLPYRLHGDAANWDQAKHAHGRQMLEVWSRYAPNLPEAVLDVFTSSPLDVERSLPNMRQGDLLVGAFSVGQVGYHRPFPGAGHYRGHLEGLYLCGSSCHPGGNITGLPGYNCAQVLLADSGMEAPWAPSPLIDRWTKLASE